MQRPSELDVERPVTESMIVPAPTAELRDHPRYELSLSITLLGDNNIYVGLSQNISEGGIFIATHRTLPIGTPVVLTFTLPRDPHPISVPGIVRWLRGPEATAHEGRSSVHSGMGVQFLGLDERASAALRDFTRWRSPEFFD